MAFSFTQTSITARTAAVAAHNRGLDNGLQGTTGVGQCGIFGPAPPREPTPSARSRFRLELNEELEGSIFSSNALMSTSAVLRAGGLVVGNIPMGASGSERGSKMALSEGAKTFAGSGRIRRRTSGKY